MDSAATGVLNQNWNNSANPYFFFQGNAWANCQSTGNVTAASGVQRQALPSGVRLVLAFAPGSGLSGNLVRDTVLAP